jgi:HSP20 family protein
MDDILQRISKSEVTTMLMRTDPFRDLDRFTQQVLGTAARPAVMPMDAWREGDAFFVEFDLPGIDQDSLDLDIERNVVTVRAQRPAVDPDREMLATERPRGVFSRQLVLGENLDTERIEASYAEGVLRLHIPVAERAKPRKISIGHGGGREALNAQAATREVIDA